MGNTVHKIHSLPDGSPWDKGLPPAGSTEHPLMVRGLDRVLSIQRPIVLAHIHSDGLARDIDGARLLWVRNLGHKPDYCATELAVAAIETLAGRNHDLESLAEMRSHALELSTN